MLRVVTVLLGLALISSGGRVSSLHIHAYTDHDHPEHHHGLADHDHHRADSHGSDSTVRLEACDPSRHAVSVVFVCFAPPQPHAVAVESINPTLPAPDVCLRGAIEITDVRVHGPPVLTESPPRAPPLFNLA